MADGLADGAGQVQRAEALTITALLADIAKETELVVDQHNAAAADPDIPGELPRTEAAGETAPRQLKPSRRRSSSTSWATYLYFLTVLWVKAWTQFCISVTLLTANMLGRLWVICEEMKHVAEGKQREFYRGAAVFLIEPNSGMRMMRKQLKEKEKGGLGKCMSSCHDRLFYELHDSACMQCTIRSVGFTSRRTRTPWQSQRRTILWQDALRCKPSR